MKIKSLLAPFLLAVGLGGCASGGRYTMKSDTAPLRKPTTLEMLDEVPRYQPIYPWSLKPYEVLGQHYVPLKTAEDYRQQGVASWYGRKFHGHLTANGETYDMYAMSAAHKTLPIPTFVRVTNLDNQKSVIVRVNDRGPFHDNRIIDLSYSAAHALDMLRTGVANVSVEAIVVAEGQTWQDSPGKPVQATIAQANPPTPAAAITPPPGPVEPLPSGPGVTLPGQKQLFVQVLAASDGARITETANQLAELVAHPRQIPREDGVYKLRFGPLKDKQQAQALISSLKNNGYPNAYMLYSAPALPHN